MILPPQKNLLHLPIPIGRPLFTTVSMDDLKIRAEALSDFATMYRYPGTEVEPLTQEVVNKAIDDANLFVKRAKELLLSASMKPPSVPSNKMPKPEKNYGVDI